MPKSTVQEQVAENDESQEEILFMATADEFCGAAVMGSSSWLLDSRCTHHMTSDVSLFKSLDENYSLRVKLGNGEFIEVKGKGVTAVQTTSGTKYIQEVLYVPDISHNLISVGQLLESGCAVNFYGDMCEVVNMNGVKILNVKMQNKSFSVNLSKSEVCAYTSVSENSNLWHKRFGHASFHALSKLHAKNMVNDMPKVCNSGGVCKTCQLDKQTRLPYPENQSLRASERLQLIHSDICGSMSCDSLNGSRYFLLFLDDYSRYCWVYFLKQKSEAFDAYERFKALVENEAGRKIRILRTDNGSEYTSRVFEESLKRAGIRHQLTVPYTPQQNGVSERKKIEHSWKWLVVCCKKRICQRVSGLRPLIPQYI